MSSSSSTGPNPRVIECLKEYDSCREIHSSLQHAVEHDMSSSRSLNSNSGHGGGADGSAAASPCPQVIASLKHLDSWRELRGSFASQELRSSLTSSQEGGEEDKRIKRLLKLEEKMDDLDQQIFRTQEMVRVRLGANNELAAVISMKHCLKLQAQREQVLRKLQQTTTTALPGSEFSVGSLSLPEEEEEEKRDDDSQAFCNDQVLAIARMQFGQQDCTGMLYPSASNMAAAGTGLAVVQQPEVIQC